MSLPTKLIFLVMMVPESLPETKKRVIALIM